jgi:hypothetical protein
MQITEGVKALLLFLCETQLTMTDNETKKKALEIFINSSIGVC